MTPADPAARRARLLSSLLVLGTFVAGGLSGAGVYRAVAAPPACTTIGFSSLRYRINWWMAFIFIIGTPLGCAFAQAEALMNPTPSCSE